MPDSVNLLGEKISEIRRKAGLRSRATTAKKLLISERAFGGYERGESLPDIDFLVRLSALTGADLTELVNLRIAAAQPERKIAVGAGGVTEAAASYVVADDSALWTKVAGELYDLVSRHSMDLTGRQFAGVLKVGARLKKADPDAPLADLLRDILDTF